MAVGSGVALCALSPHPPLIVPEVGGRDIKAVEKTVGAMKRLGAAVAQTAPDVIVVISPHAPLLEDAVAVLSDDPLTGDFAQFGAPEVSHAFPNDLELAHRIAECAAEAGITTLTFGARERRAYHVPEGLDHGVLVPMHYVAGAGVRPPIVATGMSLLPRDDLYAFGIAIAAAACDLGRRACVIASGDMSHKLAPRTQEALDPWGRRFDERIVELLAAGDVDGVLSLDPDLVERAGECGYRSLVIGLGALDGRSFRPEVLSYEGPFGVGYAVALLTPEEPDRGGSVRERLQMRSGRRRGGAAVRSSESAPVRLARSAVEEYVLHRRMIEPPDEIPAEMRGRAGVFCSIKKRGHLRGCIGTIHPTTSNIATEIIRNAIAAATEDPRFMPVDRTELADLVYSVDILTPPERVAGMDDLDPRAYGVIVRKGGRSGLLLPDLEGVDTKEEQVAIAKAKAGIGPDEDVELWRFEVKRYR